jgi:cytochrome b561
MSESEHSKFSKLTILLHWVTVLLFIGVYCSMEFRDIFDKGTAGRELMKSSHYWFGLTILFLLLVRLVARFSQHTPVITPPQPKWQHQLAMGVHLALYALMLIMPILGWLLMSAEGKDLNYLGLQLPVLLAPNEIWAERFEELHELGANFGYGLIALHTVAALFHHYLLKDNTVKRMMLK